MPIYKGRRPGTHRVVIWARGKCHEWTVEGRKKDAEQWEAKKRVELGADPLAKRRAANFREFSTIVYAAHAERHLASSTWSEVRIYQVATLVEFFGKKRLTEIAATDIEDFKVWREEDDIKASSINNELRVLKTILRHAKAMSYDVSIPTWKPLPEAGAHGHVEVWTADELRRLFAACRSEAPEVLPIAVFLANTGCRKGEAIACEWSWIDETEGLIRIPANEFWQPKSGKPREVPLSNAVRAILAGPRKHEQWVFPTIHGGRYARFPEELFRRARDAAGLSGGPHRLRHSYASHFLKAIPDLFLLAKILGHSHTRITEIYSHLLPGHLDRAKNAVDIAPPLQTMANAMAEAPPERKKRRKSV